MLQIELEPSAAALLVRAASPTPGAINSLLRRIQKYCTGAVLTEYGLINVLDLLGISGKGSATSTGLICELKSMTGVEFENWIAGLLARHGYTVKTTRTVGDHGIDLELTGSGRKVVVQCKRWNDTIGEPIIREFFGSMLNARADSGVFVTTSSFSPQAREFVKQKAITLLDLKALIDLYLHGGAVESYVER